MTCEGANNLGGRKVDRGGGVPISSESSSACVLDGVTPRLWTARWTGEGGGDTTRIAEHW